MIAARGLNSTDHAGIVELIVAASAKMTAEERDHIVSNTTA